MLLTLRDRLAHAVPLGPRIEKARLQSEKFQKSNDAEREAPETEGRTRTTVLSVRGVRYGK
jgi:hypothetical protein